MEGLSYSIANEDDIIFKVYSHGYNCKVAQVVVPFSGADGVAAYGFSKKVENTFHQNPHCIGNEGECYHLHTSVTISIGDILAYLLRVNPGCVTSGPTVTSLKKRRWHRYVGEDILTPPMYYYTGSDGDCPIYFSGSFVIEKWQGTYHVSNTGSTSIIRTELSSGHRKQQFSITKLVCDEAKNILSYDLKEVNYYSKDSDYYKDYLGRPGYKPANGGVQKTTTKHVEETPRTWFIKVSKSAFLEARKSLKEAFLEFVKGNPLAKVHFMPVEESFLDDLYESLGIPSMNSVATILELLGSIRNAKSVAAVFKKIKRNGGIRQTLIKEGSQILKDKKLSTASNLYLTKKYVYDTTRMDIDDFFDKLSTRLGQLPFPVQHFRWFNTPDVNSEAVHCIRLAYQPYEYSNAELYGFDLPMEATWDCLPYSFIIDWFCSFGDSLESIDKVDALKKVKVVSCTESLRVVTKRCYDVVVNGVTVQFYTQSVFYNRTVTDSLPPVYPRSPKLSNPFHHIIDGAALVFARR